MKKMLVVDDEPMLCRALGALFREKGFRVTTAGTAREALDRIASVNADVVLLDLKLPDGSGLDVLSTLKKRFPDLRVVVISALADQPTIQEAMQRGASDYLAKPFDFDRCFYAAMGLEAVDLGLTNPEPSALARMPAAVAQQYRALPLRVDGKTLHVAMADPLDAARLDELKARLGCPMTPYGVIAGDVMEAIRRSYRLEDATPEPSSRTTSSRPAPAAAEDAEASQAARELIQAAHAHRASDLHVGIGPSGSWIRERVDGVLSDVPAPPKLAALHDRVASHLKGLARLDIAERRIPQQGGRIELEVDGVTLDLRLSVLPTAHGEHLAIRILEPVQALSFEKLGWYDDQRLAMASLLAKPAGLLLVTGPSGAGKSATLYACLSKLLKSAPVNIVTVEDPIERELSGVTQFPAQSAIGVTMAEGLRAALHHDPDVVMVGELEDAETARLAVRTALTGHLVLSALHTNDASSGITRLLDLGIEPFFLCSTLSGIVSQRLVRKLCAACRERYEVEAVSLTHLGIVLPKSAGAVPVWRAKGCERCRHTGFRGQTGFFELLVVDSHIRSLMIKRASGAQIRQSAISRGMLSLPQSLWQHIRAGVTSLEELIRVLPPAVH